MWIAELSVDLIECTLVCAITSDPDGGRVDQRFSFRDVGDLRVERFHDPQDVCLGDFDAFNSTLLGGGRARFRLNTGDAIVTFEAAEDFDTKAVSSAAGE